MSDGTTAEDLDSWAEMDDAFDRETGPFDVDEVDLDADDVQRIELGALVATPFPGMTMQLQVDKTSKKVQAILVGDGSSALEAAVFAGPSRTSMLPELRQEIIAATQRAKGKITVVQGPYGAELRRRVPVKDAKGNQAIHVTRTWLVDGPGWVLRGVVMGKAALEPNDTEAALALNEFFGNLVVHRGTQPAAPGSLIPLTMPPQAEQTSQS
ncbi:MAG: DUF3710 domain-containing protein [Arachnia sp.]